MKHSLHPIIFLLFLSSLILNHSCTDNPFGQDEISSESQTIRGSVKLQNDSPEDVFVWLEGFDMGTYTNTQGNFELRLSSSSRYSNLTGNFKLYFFVANYNIDTASVVIHNGEVKFSLGDLDENGKLKREIYLTQLLNIELVANEAVFDDVIPLRDVGKIFMELTFEATSSSVPVEFPGKTEGPLGIIFLQRISPDEEYQKMLYTNSLALENGLAMDNVTSAPRYWTGSFNKRTIELPIGSYRILPYCIIHQPNVPDELWNHFCPNKNNPTIDFANLPIKINGGIFETKN